MTGIVILDHAGSSGSHDHEAFRRAAAAVGAPIRTVGYAGPGDLAVAAIRTDECAILRADIVSDEELKLAADVLWALEQRGVRCLPTAEGLVAAEDKIRTHVRLRQAGVSTPPFLAVCPAAPRAVETAAFHARLQSYPVVLKRPVGSDGRGTELCADAESLVRVLEREATARPEGLLLLQPFIPHERSVTALVADGRVVAAHATAPATGEFRATTRFGGTRTRIDPSDAVRRTALAAAAACALSHGAVELLEGSDGAPTVICTMAVPTLRADDPCDSEFAASLVTAALRDPVA